MGIKASEVGAWLRKSAGKRDHYELMPEDYVVVRPGPNFDLLLDLLDNPATAQPRPLASDRSPASDGGATDGTPTGIKRHPDLRDTATPTFTRSAVSGGARRFMPPV